MTDRQTNRKMDRPTTDKVIPMWSFAFLAPQKVRPYLTLKALTPGSVIGKRFLLMAIFSFFSWFNGPFLNNLHKIWSAFFQVNDTLGREGQWDNILNPIFLKQSPTPPCPQAYHVSPTTKWRQVQPAVVQFIPNKVRTLCIWYLSFPCALHLLHPHQQAYHVVPTTGVWVDSASRGNIHPQHGGLSPCEWNPPL